MARRPSPARWICPLCERSVPPNEPTCYCGTSRAAVLAHAQRERARKTRPFPWKAFLGELGVVAIVLYWFVARREIAEVPSLSTPVATPPAFPSAQPVAASPPNPLAAAVTRPTETPSPRTSAREGATQATPAPAPSKSPGPVLLAKPDRAELDVQREEGEKHLEQTLARLQAEVARLTENARQFEVVCLGHHGERRSCERAHEEIASSGESLARDLEGAEDDARHSWVSPGVVRDLRQKHGLEEGTLKDLSERVHYLVREFEAHP